MVMHITENLIKYMVALAIAVVLSAGSLPVFAASGSVYTCTINRLYQHPVTGEIEDSGGEQSYAVGQGMIEGCIYPTGILEVTDSGEYYLTIRVSLMDYTSGHSFEVQSWGDTDWEKTSAGITGTGTDSNGSTADICIKVPNENCIVRGTMFVETMGRDVIWYMFPDNYKSGNSTDITATMVTESAVSTVQSEEPATQPVYEPETEPQTYYQVQEEPSQQNTAAEQSYTDVHEAVDSSSTPSNDNKIANGNTAEEKDSKAEETTSSEIILNSIQKEVAEPETDDESLDLDYESIGKAKGLTLSTASSENVENETDIVNASGDQGAGSRILESTLSILIPGLILIAACVLAVYFIRKNWHKWGHAPDDDE